MRKIVTVVISISVLFSFQVWQGDAASASGKEWKIMDKLYNCSLAGSWLVVSPDGDKNVVTFVPLDPAGKRFAAESEEFVPEDPTLDGFFPDAINVTEFRGIAEKTSRNTYDFTFYQFASDAKDNLQYELVISGSSKLIDCDKRVSVLSVELIIPDFGSFCLFTTTSQSVRFRIRPPCDELPPFPDYDPGLDPWPDFEEDGNSEEGDHKDDDDD